MNQDTDYFPWPVFYLGDEGRGGGRLIFEVWWENTLLSVVAGESVNSGFDKNQTEFTVTVLKDKFIIISIVIIFFQVHVRYIFRDLKIGCEHHVDQGTSNTVIVVCATTLIGKKYQFRVDRTSHCLPHIPRSKA